jgi:hypothetical protein
MTDHDRLRERLRALDSVQPSPGLMVRARSSEPQRQPSGPSGGRRFVVMVTAFAVFGASAILVWQAFDPMGTRGDAVATPNLIGVQPPDWVVRKAIQMATNNQDPSPTSAYWILSDSATLHPVVDPALSDAGDFPPGIPEYFVVLYGAFTDVNARVPEGANPPTGSVLTFTLIRATHGVNDFGIDSQPIHLEGLQPFSLLSDGTSPYVNEVGLPISMSYPTGWFAESTGQPGDPTGPRQRGVVIANTRAAMPSRGGASSSSGPRPESSILPPHFVRVTIVTNGEKGPPDPGSVDSPLPLSMSDAQFGGPGNVRGLSATVAGVRLTFTIQAGPEASDADLAAADDIVASVAPTYTGSTPAVSTDAQPPAWVVVEALRMAASNQDANPTSAEWVLKDTAAIAPAVGLTPDQGSTNDVEYLVVLHGSFTATGAKVPFGEPVPTGTDLAFTLDPTTHGVLDWTVGDRSVEIAGLQPLNLHPGLLTPGSAQDLPRN